MKKQLIVDGTSLLDFGVWISGEGVFNKPSKDITVTEIPGRNGTLSFSNKRYKNLTISYNAFIHRGFLKRFDAMAAFLNSTDSYRRLEDGYFPNMYRIGRINGAINPSNVYFHSGKADVGMFKLSFDCWPQHFLQSGDVVKEYTKSGTIHNPSYEKALPLLRVYGTGEIKINDESITVLNHSTPYIDIDCEAMDAYYGDQNMNSYIKISGDTFPGFKAMENNITFPSKITKIEVTPRWWTL